MIKIGSLDIDTNIFLAPLAGCADLSFRLISREHGAKFCFYEMVDSNSLVYGQGTNKDILMTHPDDQPIAAQILGSDPDVMLEAAKILLARINPVFLDVNAACPAKKIQRKKTGAYLIHEPKALYAIVEKLAANLDLPITVKLRVGYNTTNLNVLAAIAKNCAKSGAAALFVHGRTCKQLYRGVVDYEAIKVVKRSVSIPVFGSGDVLSPFLAKKMLDETGCDGVLVARGAMGNPWIFRRIEKYLKTGQDQPEIPFSKKKKVVLKHLAYLEKYRQSRPSNKLGLMKKIAILYLKYLPDASRLRSSVTQVEDYQKLVKVIKNINV
ncbi:MAG: tRNA dihydrouridine synthase DusB [Candidatus Margulisiibacteriota bacterium]